MAAALLQNQYNALALDGVAVPTPAQQTSLDEQLEAVDEVHKVTYGVHRKFHMHLTSQLLVKYVRENRAKVSPFRMLTLCRASSVLDDAQWRSSVNHLQMLLLGDTEQKSDRDSAVPYDILWKAWWDIMAGVVACLPVADTFLARVRVAVSQEVPSQLALRICMAQQNAKNEAWYKSELAKARQEFTKELNANKRPKTEDKAKTQLAHGDMVCPDWLANKCENPECGQRHWGPRGLLEFLMKSKKSTLSDSEKAAKYEEGKVNTPSN